MDNSLKLKFYQNLHQSEETFGLEREKSSYLDRMPLYMTRVMFRFMARAEVGGKVILYT